MSIKTGTPPLNTNAFAVETNVKDGMMISSPGFILSSKALISSADVHEWVSRAFLQLILSSSQSWHLDVKEPSPASCVELCAL